MQVVSQIGTQLSTPSDQLQVTLLQARSALHGGQPAQALEALNRADLLANTLATECPTALLFDRLLLKGTVANFQSDRALATECLSQAAAVAEEMGDQHALGRVANNLANVLLSRGETADAAEAYERSINAKYRSGDVRGRGVALLNRALALRELGTLDAAYRAATDARAIAERVGDRRGQAMGALTMAQLAVDVGARTRAVEAGEILAKMTISSDVVRANAAVVLARVSLANGQFEEAQEWSTQAESIASTIGIPSLEREARAVGFLITMKPGESSGGSGVSTDQLEALSVDYETTVEQGHGRQQPLLGACLALALVHVGRWEESRALMETAIPLLGSPVRPGLEAAVGLLQSAARIMGESAVQSQLHELAGITIQHRITAQHHLNESSTDLEDTDGPVSTDEQSVATALGIEWQTQEKNALDRLLQLPSEREEAMERTVDSRVHTTFLVLDHLAVEDTTNPKRWAEAVGSATGADGSALFALTDSGAKLVEGGTGSDDGTQLDALCATVVRSGQPFAARGPSGGLERLGVLLRSTPKEEPSGVLFLSWKEGKEDSTESVMTALQTVLPLVSVVLERAHWGTQIAELRMVQQSLEERSLAERTAYEDEVSSLRDALHYSRTEAELRYSYDQIVHRSRKMKRVLQTFDKVTDSDVSVLVRGESGVGKELMARALHYNGPRRLGVFVAENCGAIPAELFESVFFGHVRGAFTGAGAARRGLVDAARGGTLFLDEVGELRPEHQVKLLRVLQERRYRPVGGDREMDADFRLVAATNRDLEEMVRTGDFREDLYYRLAVVTVSIPPLRERVEDILPIAQALAAAQSGKPVDAITFSSDAVQTLTQYGWPGNVRELENEIMRALVLSEGRSIEARYFSDKIRGRTGGSDAAAGSATLAWDGEASLDAVVSNVEQTVITTALRVHGGRKASVARALGISRPGLDAKIGRYGIDVKAIKAAVRGSSAGMGG